MRDIKKHPNNANVVTVYLPNDVLQKLDEACEMSGLSRGKVLTQMAREALPKAKMAPRTYVVHELSFE